MPTLEISQTIDARGLSCPMPIVKTAQASSRWPRRCRRRTAGHRSGLDQGRRARGAGRPAMSSRPVVDGSVYRFVIRRK